MKILFVGTRDTNHSAYGGYDKIALMPNTEWLSKKNAPFSKSNNRILIRVNAILLDIKVRLIAKNYDIVHFFYGDAFIRLPYKSNRAKFVTTIHLDFNQKKFLQIGFEKSVKSMNGIIVLSSQQKKDLIEKYGIKAEFIPHGFNKPIFDEKEQKTIDQRKINIVFIGQNYRDLETFIFIVKKNYPNILFHCIGQSNIVKQELKKYKNVIVYDRLNDNDYYSLINQSDYNFLPLKYATANNALLEAQYLDVRSILPNIPGVSDYAIINCGNLFYNNLEELDNIFKTLQKYKKNDNLSTACNKFTWKNIYKELLDYYGKL